MFNLITIQSSHFIYTILNFCKFTDQYLKYLNMLKYVQESFYKDFL